MSSPIDPKDPNLMMSYVLTVAAMAIKLRSIEMQITSHPGILDEDNRFKMLEAIGRVDGASKVLLETLIREQKPKDQDWGPCAKCGGRYRYETLGAYGMDAFKVTKIVCSDCGFTVNWHDDPNGETSKAWEAARLKAKSEKLGETMAKLKALPPPTLEEVDTQMKSSAKFREEQDERRDSDKR